MRPMRIEENHAHAYMIYEPTDVRHFWALLISFIVAKKQRAISLTTHLPFEIQHSSKFGPSQIKTAKLLIWFGEKLKKLFAISLYWENCPIVNTDNWELLYGQNEWQLAPENIDLCLDTGHLMMNAKNKKEARERIKTILKKRGKQIRHVHIHENDFLLDRHWDPRKMSVSKRVITTTLLRELQRNRSFIFEKPS